MAGTCDLLRSRKRILLFKLQTDEGALVVPDPAVDAVKFISVEVRGNPNLLEDAENTGKLDAPEFDIGGMSFQIPVSVNTKPGPDGVTAPEAGKLLKVSGLSKLSAAEILATATGGTTKTVTANRAVDTDLPADEGALVGRAIIVGDNKPTLIISYAVSGTIVTIGLGKALAVAPTNEDLLLPEGIGYRPTEDCPPVGTAYVYEDGTLWKMFDCRGTVSWSVDAGGKPVANINLTGFCKERIDATYLEDDVAYQDSRPGVWKDGEMAIDSQRCAVSQLTLDLNNKLPYPGDPNELEGFLPATITGRGIQGQVNPLTVLLATRNIFADFRNGTKRPISALIPGSGGHFTGITIPAAKYRDDAPADREGLLAETAPFSAIDDGSTNPEKGDFSFVLFFFYGPSGS